MRQVESFVAAGGKELVLSGINLGRWGRDLGVMPRNVRGIGARDSGRDGIAAAALELD